MLKPLTKEAQFECGILEVTKLCALTPVTTPNGVGLGIAIANEHGYVPISLTWCHSDTWTEMQEHADSLNAELFGHDRSAALNIVASTMVRSA